MSAPPLLSAVGVSKAYVGVQALRHASFTLQRGEVHALVGENGAGKSTLIKILSGAVQPDSGEIVLDGIAVGHSSPRSAKAAGIACIHQQPSLFPDLTVAENIAIGVEKPALFGLVNWGARHRHAESLLRRVGASIDPETVAADLSMPEQQLVEIARALGADAKVLILDEPTASLSSDDAARLFAVLRELRGAGVGIIYISHRLEELPAIADVVTVLRDGTTIETCPMRDVSRERLIRMMVGRDLSALFPKRPVTPGETVLALNNLGCTEGGVRAVDLVVRAGEIVGLAGLVGAGRTELARAIFGLTPADSGTIELKGTAVLIGTPAEAIGHGIAYLPEDRRHHGVLPEMSVMSNMTLASLKDFSAPRSFGTLDRRREEEVSVGYVQRLGVKTPSVHAPVLALSGGNQQKVALSRWLLTKPTLLILDEPTQGIDVGAKAEIHELITSLAERGVAVLMISSDLPEVLGMSDRIVVMRGGTVVTELSRDDATPERILALALGGGG